MSYFENNDIPYSLIPTRKFPYVPTPYDNSSIFYKSKYKAFVNNIEYWLKLHPEYEFKIEAMLCRLMDVIHSHDYYCIDSDECSKDIIYFMYKIHKEKDNNIEEGGDYSNP